MQEDIMALMTNDTKDLSENKRVGIMPSEPVHLDVLPYDEEHEKILLTQPFANRLRQMAATGLSLSFEEIMTLGMFTEQKSIRPGWQTFRELRKRAPTRFTEIQDYFCAEDGRLGATFSPLETGNHRTERMGVAISIAAANQLLGTTDADWERIEIAGQKTLDFRLAATQYGLVQLEAKGCVSEYVRLKTPAVSKAMGQIREKKKEKREQANHGILLGTIAVIPTVEGNPNPQARVYLLDPPVSVPDLDHEWVKLYSRLSYYRRVLACFSQSNLTLALADRLETLRRPDIYRALDGVPLVNARREPLRIPTFSQTTTVFLGRRIFGKVIPVHQGLLFLGIDSSVASLLIAQKFERITTFRSRLTSSQIRIQSQTITIDEASSREIGLAGERESGGSAAVIVVSGKIAVLPSGVAGGFLRIEPSPSRMLSRP